MKNAEERTKMEERAKKQKQAESLKFELFTVPSYLLVS